MTGEQPADAKTTRAIETAAVVLVALGLLLRLLVAGQPPERLLPVCLADDTFYYLGIAQHIAQGDGPTFDGRIPTNGYHPLWMLVSLAAVKATGGVVSAACVLTFLLALIGAGNAMLLWRLAGRLFGPWGGAWAAAFWALNPYVLFTELMGVEAPLMMLFALAALRAYLPLREAGETTPRRWAVVGFWLGLAMLARTDAVLLAAPLGIDVLLLRRGALGRRLAYTVYLAGAALMVVTPWLIYNFVFFGTIVQDSAHALLLRERLWFAASGASLGDKLSAQAATGFADYLMRLAGLPNAALIGLLAGLLAGAGVTARLAAPAARRSPGGTWVFFAWGALVWAFYVLYFWQQKYWYFLPVLLVLALAGAWAIGGLAAAAPRRATTWVATLLGIVLLAGFASVGTRIWRNGYQPWQTIYVQAAQYVRELARQEPDTKVAAMNAGVLSAYSGLPVVNLDGVVNPDAWEALRDRDLLGYLRREQITVVVDHVKLLASYGVFASADWTQSFRLLRQFPTPPFAGDVVALRVLAPGETP